MKKCNGSFQKKRQRNCICFYFMLKMLEDFKKYRKVLSFGSKNPTLPGFRSSWGIPRRQEIVTSVISLPWIAGSEISGTLDWWMIKIFSAMSDTYFSAYMFDKSRCFCRMALSLTPNKQDTAAWWWRSAWATKRARCLTYDFPGSWSRYGIPTLADMKRKNFIQ